jgi:hypothetical protein
MLKGMEEREEETQAAASSGPNLGNGVERAVAARRALREENVRRCRDQWEAATAWLRRTRWFRERVTAWLMVEAAVNALFVALMFVAPEFRFVVAGWAANLALTVGLMLTCRVKARQAEEAEDEAYSLLLEAESELQLAEKGFQW